MSATELARKIDDRTAVVGIIGLGHVGLPLALTVVGAGFDTVGFDVDPEKIRTLAAGRSYLEQFDTPELAAAIASGKLDPTLEFERLDSPDILLICVPTPLTPDQTPDLQYVDSTSRAIRERLRDGQLVVLESTTYPGTTEERILPELVRTGLSLGSDFFLAYSPEREDPGNPDFRTSQIPKVVAGTDPASSDLADRFYRTLVPTVVRVSNCRTAEATKLFENVFRAVNIALVNELKIIYEAMGVDIWEVLDAAETKPFGFMRFDPGPGWGGHCIPVDPFYLTWKAAQHGRQTRFIELAGEINVQMPQHVIERLAKALAERQRDLAGSRILLLGLAYKRDVQDIRESPGMELLRLLDEAGAEVEFHDPHVQEIPAMRRFPKFAGRHSRRLDSELLCSVDAAILVTDHQAVDYQKVLSDCPLVVDTRGRLPVDLPHVVRA